MEQAGESVPAYVPTPTPTYAPPTPPQEPPHAPRPLMDGEPPRRLGNRRFPWGMALIALVIVVGSGIVLYTFASAKVTITPTAKTTTVSGDFTATFNSGDLPYQIVTVDKTVSANVPAESTETVNDPAQGTITISNTQDTSQTLIKNTRFQSTGGLIYRIQDSVTIPGGSISSPGTIKATVYADTGGDQYNIAPTTFTVPGLKGSASFDKVTAKSTEAFTGGFSGTRASVSDATRTAQNQKSQSSLNDALTAAVTAQLPVGYVAIPGGTVITYVPATDTVGKDNSVNVNLKGTAVAVVLPSSALAKAISYRTNGSYTGQPVTIKDASALKMTPSLPGTPTAEQGTFAFSLAGNATIVYDIDTAKIAGAVAGKNRTAAYTIIQGFPEVSRAVLNVRPFWKTSFPDDPSDIVVATTSPSE
ncbi:MAG: hypothetical protein JWL75_406 [Parcubacteria group bacterium]|nr:hypothetical protein [Parcubacteria group bacterium]